MALDSVALAEEIKGALGFSSEPTSQKNKDIATAIVEHLKTAVVNHATSTVTGTAPSSGGPLQDGAATNGVITLVATDLQTRLISAFGVSTPEILGMGTAISTHVATGLVEFTTGNITGTCGNTSSSPGPLVGEGSGGEITNLDGSTLATLMASSMGKPGTTLELEAMATAIVDHIQNNAEAAYSTGFVTGTCPSGGGPITAGTGAGGTIS